MGTAVRWSSPPPTTPVSRNTNGNGIFGEIPITIPVGSRLISVDTLVLDTAGRRTYSVDLVKTTITALGVTVAHLGFVSGSVAAPADWCTR
jgi:hypothetical protein